MESILYVLDPFVLYTNEMIGLYISAIYIH
jgi:hypothetical protein